MLEKIKKRPSGGIVVSESACRFKHLLIPPCLPLLVPVQTVQVVAFAIEIESPLGQNHHGDRKRQVVGYSREDAAAFFRKRRIFFERELAFEGLSDFVTYRHARMQLDAFLIDAEGLKPLREPFCAQFAFVRCMLCAHRSDTLDACFQRRKCIQCRQRRTVLNHPGQDSECFVTDRLRFRDRNCLTAKMACPPLPPGEFNHSLEAGTHEGS